MAAYLHLTKRKSAFFCNMARSGPNLNLLVSVPDAEVLASFEFAIVAYLDQLCMTHTDTDKSNNGAPLRHDMLVVKAIES